LKDKAAAEQTVQFILWAETEGQELANGKGYARMPKEAVDKVQEEIKSIKFDGEPLLK
jgi:phosphate transport system substrate-binding protein